MTRTFSGRDSSGGALTAVMLIFAAIQIALSLGQLRWVMWLVFALLVLAPIGYVSARFRLTVGHDGILLERGFAFLLWDKSRYHLDSDVRLYESWESFEPEGVYLHAVPIGESSSECFGPSGNVAQISVLCDQIDRAIRDARGEVSGIRPLRAEGFCNGDFRVIERSPGGPPRRLMNRRLVRYRGVEIPIASMFVFNNRGWVDPGREDVLDSIELAGTAVLPNGVEVGPGARLHYFRDCVSITGGLPDRVSVGELTVFGTKPLQFDIEQRYALRQYTLAADAMQGGVHLPAGTEVRPSFMEGGWSVVLGAGVTLRDVHACKGDTIDFDAKWRPTMVSLRRSRAAVTRQSLVGELTAIPIRRDGRVDLRACRRRGLLRNA